MVEVVNADQLLFFEHSYSLRQRDRLVLPLCWVYHAELAWTDLVTIHFKHRL